MREEFGPIMVLIIVTVSVVAGTVLSIVKTIVRSKYPQWGKNGNVAVPPMFEKMFEKAIAERDEKIRKLEDRVAVLEKIVTDNHGANKLADEIERLRS